MRRIVARIAGSSIRRAGGHPAPLALTSTRRPTGKSGWQEASRRPIILLRIADVSDFHQKAVDPLPFDDRLTEIEFIDAVADHRDRACNCPSSRRKSMPASVRLNFKQARLGLLHATIRRSTPDPCRKLDRTNRPRTSSPSRSSTSASSGGGVGRQKQIGERRLRLRNVGSLADADLHGAVAAAQDRFIRSCRRAAWCGSRRLVASRRSVDEILPRHFEQYLLLARRHPERERRLLRKIKSDATMTLIASHKPIVRQRA